MTTETRQERTSDIKTLIALSRRTISASYRVFLGDQAVDAFIHSGADDEYVRENIGCRSVILADAKIVGYSVTKDNLIDLMMIDHEFHRCGLGTRLLQYVEERLFRIYDELVLESFEGNQRANSFYRKNGWIETRTFFDKSSGVNKVVFKKTA